jgi:hypothetical protein
MSGRSKSNGNQLRALLREAGSLQRRIDRVIALADKEVGIGAPARAAGTPPGTSWPSGRPAPISAAPVIPGAGVAPALSPLVGTPGFGLPTAPIVPTALPPGSGTRDSGLGRTPSGESRSAVFGVPGTPITSGFLIDLGEYNPELMGRNAVAVYEQMRRGDAQVRATLAAVKLPIQSAKWDVVPSDKWQVASDKQSNSPLAPKIRGHSPLTSSTGAGRATEAKAKEIAEFVKDNLFGGLEFQTPSGGWVTQSWDEVVRNALLMLEFGCAIHEDVYTVDGDRIRLRKLASRLPLTFYRWHTDPASVVPGLPVGVYDDGETLYAVEQYGYRAYNFLNVLLPADKIARFTYQQEGANFWGIALLRAMYPHWYVKSALYRIDSIANERNALGIPVWKLSPGFSREDRDAAFDFVTQLAAHEATGVVEPPGDQNTGLRIVGFEGRIRDVMPSIQHHNVMISRAALAMFMELGQEGRTGSRALGKEHIDFFMLGLQNVADQIATTITASTVKRLVYLNFGEDAPVPRLLAANVQARSLEDLSDALAKFAMAGLIVSEENLRKFIRQELALPEESTRAVVAIKGEAVAEGGGTGAPPVEVEGKGASGEEIATRD